MSFNEVLAGITIPPFGINARLDAIAAVVQAAVPFATVYAPDLSVGPDTVFPCIQIYPWKEHLERTDSGMHGNAMWNQGHTHGPDKYRVVILQAPLEPGLDEQGLKRELNDITDLVRAALVAAIALPDASGNPTALDAGDYILAEWDPQGQLCEWHRRAYVGCYLTVDIQKLWTSP